MLVLTTATVALVALVTLMALLALVPLWRHRPAGRGGLFAPVALSLAALAAVIATSLTLPDATVAPRQRALEVLAPGHAGSGACRSCHPAQYASWHGSYHRTMSQVATPATLVPQFARLDLDWFGKPVVLEWRGERLWVTFQRGGIEPAAVDRPVEQLTGSHHLQVLWYSTGRGRELAPVPLVYKIEERLWLPLTAVFVLPPEYRDPPEPGVWSQSCVMCHTTAARPRIDSGVNDTHVGELGIACEACHGPGAEHVASNQNPLRRYLQRAAGEDDTIVNPGTLDPVRSAQACGQCHSVSILRERHFDAWSEHGSPFVPGQDLHATHLVIGPEDRDSPELRRELQRNPNFFASSFWSDGQVRIAGRELNGLRQSPCYTHGDPERQLDCSSCHRLHQEDGSAPAAWRDDQLHDHHPDAEHRHGDRRGNAACTQCHPAFATPAALAAHTHHAPESSGSSCYNCHMSHTSIGLMKATRSHTVGSPSVQSELATGRPNACNQCHLDRTLEWTANNLQANWGIPAPDLDAGMRSVAASVRWLLSGDAGQRTLAAWSYAWPEAQQASGTDWQAPYLARLLDDPYYVVRFNAARALRSLPDAAASLTDYDFLAAAAQARSIGERVHAQWLAGYRGPPRPALLLDAAGLQQEPFQQLFARRDDRPVFLAE